jgi:hypothetical protein
MPADFERCVRNGGRVRTIKHGKDKYQHICYDKEGSHAGEVKTKKKESK